MTMYTELLQAALKEARIAYTKAKTDAEKAEWQHLIKICLEELNATHGRVIC